MPNFSFEKSFAGNIPFCYYTHVYTTFLQEVPMIRSPCVFLLYIVIGVFSLFLFFIPNSYSGENMNIKSVVFTDGGSIRDRYVMKAIGRMNISLPFKWENAPTGTKSFALSIVDPHPVAKNWIHWLVIDLPSLITGLKEGISRKEMPPESKELENSFGNVGCGGPQPPGRTGDHTPMCVRALSVDKLGLSAETSLAFQSMK